MRTRGKDAAAALQRQDGFTLIELTVTAAMLAVVLLAILSVSDLGWKLAPKDQERTHMIRETQTGLYQMTRELRQGYEVVDAQPSVMQVRVLVQGNPRLVTYRCDVPHPTKPAWRRCVRSGDGPDRVVLDRLLDDNVFEYTRRAPGGPITYVRAKAVVPAAGDLAKGHPHRVVLDDGFYMRNQNLR
jgi:prepilin-type N-terminal cleavage/methylation domain-containing protein